MAVTVGLIAAVAGGAIDRREERVTAVGTTCVGSNDSADLTALFDLEPDGMIAADYQRAVALPDGRTLWTFQDATFRLPPPDPDAPSPPPGTPEPPTERLVHNAALIQTGTCFERLGGWADDDPASWLFAAETQPFAHWFWPLDATIGNDGRIWVFMAEMAERGPLYLSATEPIATRVAVLDPNTLGVISTGRPPNDSASLYGFSITEDDAWTYLYAHCHRQFGWDAFFFGPNAHDLSCSADVKVARVPRGQMLDAPAYWDGTTWHTDPARAVGVISRTGRAINPTQVEWTGGEFLAVTKEGDWFGTTIYLDHAPTAHGPWSTYARVPATPKCDRTVCNTYFASWVPNSPAGGRLTIGLSHNRWDGRVSPVNRPTFLSVPRPDEYPLAVRCGLVEC